jgi:hypothetical protein
MAPGSPATGGGGTWVLAEATPTGGSSALFSVGFGPKQSGENEGLT